MKKRDKIMKSLKVASFFSGCGGLDMGMEGGFWVKSKSITNQSWVDRRSGDFVRLKPTSFKTVFACDIKPSAKKAWEGYFKKDDVFHLESIVDIVKKAKAGEFVFPDVDIVTGGFPCQDFSIAGKRNGFSSHKTHKNKINYDTPTIETRGMLYYWLREAISIINPKIFIAENVKGLISIDKAKEVIVEDFRNINGGYIVLDPKVLHAGDFGIPQSRERVIFIGVRKDLISTTTIKEIENDRISLYPSPTHNHKNNFVSVEDAIFDLCEPEQSKDLSHQKYSKAKWYGKHCQGQIEISPNKLAPTIRAEHHGNIEFRRLSKENGGLIESEFTLPQRRLSVRECARIQTFPDDYQFVTDKLGASEAYKLIGNAVPPLLGYHIARQLEAVWGLLFALETTKKQSTINKVA